MRRILCLVLVLSALAGWRPAAAARLLTICGANLPPYSIDDDGKLSGVVLEVAVELAHRVGNTTDIQMLPWPRAYQTVLDGKCDVLLSVSRIPERETEFRWIGPIFSDTLAVLTYDTGKKLSLDEAKRLELVAVQQGTPMELWARQAGLTNLDVAIDTRTIVRKMAAKRDDAWLSIVSMAYWAGKQGGLDVTKLSAGPGIREVQIYIAMALEVPDSTFEQWNGAWDAMVADGTADRIRAPYKVTD